MSGAYLQKMSMIRSQITITFMVEKDIEFYGLFCLMIITMTGGARARPGFIRHTRKRPAYHVHRPGDVSANNGHKSVYQMPRIPASAADQIIEVCCRYGNWRRKTKETFNTT